ncbi:phosphatase PAP2 family protein [Altibacter sp.]|uniref:phosphatase PAP2 family protein n=1 Tax=Altibacter sp. TaxID=2024823 RepID=UPI000C981E42|nr:phosphatase PAP2 family protein [Altibacter sp.]MAP54841.1 phosphoesterase PA-phosphatase [Altibacter sp.]
MKKITIFTSLLLCISQLTFAQKSDSPYEWDWTRDGIWTGVGLGASAGGLLLIQNKKDITEEELQEILANQDNINFLDEWAVGNDSEDANMISDIPFALSFATPFVLLFDDETNDHTGQILGLYLESLATTAGMYTITAGLVNRSRPYVYSEDVDLGRRLRNNGQRSFYSGHVAATATATFFAAKVFSDFNPDASGKAWVWTGAAVLPAAVGYFRLEAGQHFLTDVLLGYGLGAVTGYFVPELHKKKNENVTLYPSAGVNRMTGDAYKGMALRVTF